LVDSLLARMTLDEKLGQLTMAPGGSDQTGPTVPAGGDADARAGRIGSTLSFWGAARTRALQRIAVQESRLGIPLLFAHDVIHGWRTTFPVPLGMAASFDPASAERAARIAAVEAAAHGVHWTFAPMVDIARDARWGRIVEGAGEDPYLGSLFAAAQVRGFQGDDLASDSTIAATAKHFAAYGAAEAGRDYNPADVSERTLWETYLPPFEAAVRANVATFMASFNEINGTPAHASRWLLGDVLREHWGWRGVVVSDWTGVRELIQHGIGDSTRAAERALHAGVDIEMSSTLYRVRLGEAIGRGILTMAMIDSAVARVLRLKQALGLFDDPYRYSDTTRERTRTLTPAHRAASREIAQRSIVLLQNRGNVLPLRRDLARIAVIGPLADDAKSMIGNWWGIGRKEDAVTIAAGIRAAVPTSRVTVVRGVPADTIDRRGIPAAEAAARRADAVILVLGEREDQSAEAASRTSIELPGAQLELARRVLRAARAGGRRVPVVAVLANGRPLALQELSDSVPALVESWFLGVEHGNAVADVLFGAVNPSGKLPVTFPRVTGQVPIYYDHRNTGRPPSASDKYTSKYLDAPWTPLFVFGHGLSYTTFAYDALEAPAEFRTGDSLRVRVRVTNTGARAGDEVVQLYLRDDIASVTRPVRQLVGIARVSLAPRESRTVDFTIAPAQMAFIAPGLLRIIEPGTFTLWAGGSSAATLERRVRATGESVRLDGPLPRGW
ncbi:MAG: glycoside hydrolase family 3 C-terminal domain-containing protein, partial [Gemmatimonadaceae bacterium]|nr:glycoside hydrolase family 3 C-terminal domain-containing protein [Gemmatimonadaceae bacterium]